MLDTQTTGTTREGRARAGFVSIGDELTAYEEALRALYAREVRLTAEELASRHEEGILRGVSDVVDEARIRAYSHPWVEDPARAVFLLGCSDHPNAAAEAGEAIRPTPVALDWKVLASEVFLADVLDALVMHAKFDLLAIRRLTEVAP